MSAFAYMLIHGNTVTEPQIGKVMSYHIIFLNLTIYNVVKSVKVYTSEVTWLIATRICFI